MMHDFFGGYNFFKMLSDILLAVGIKAEATLFVLVSILILVFGE